VDRDPVITAFDDAAADYRTVASPFLGACTDLVLDRLNLRPNTDLADLACGPGTIALPAAQRLGRDGSVMGIDLAERQLTVARNVVSQGYAPAGPTMRFQHQDACAPGLADDSADAVACALGLPYFREPVRAVRESVRIARRGAPVVWTVWGTPFFGRPGERFLHFLAREDIGPPLEHLIYATEDLAQLAFRAGLQEVVVEEHDIDARFPGFDAWWDMARAFAFLVTADAAEPEARDTVRERLQNDPGIVDEDDAVRCRLRLLLLRGVA
jgi:ubiquinone/menaquinone biosynthesis C-methylase UbiE